MQIRRMTFVYVLMVAELCNMKNDSYRASHHKKSLIFSLISLMNDHRWCRLSFICRFFPYAVANKATHIHTAYALFFLHYNAVHTIWVVRQPCASLSPLEHRFELAFPNELWLYIIMCMEKGTRQKCLLTLSQFIKLMCVDQAAKPLVQRTWSFSNQTTYTALSALVH